MPQGRWPEGRLNFNRSDEVPRLVRGLRRWYNLRMTHTDVMEAIVRDLTTYGDTIGRTAVDLITDLGGWSGEPPTEVIAIVQRHLDHPMTDSDVDDLLEFTDTDDDNFND